MRLTHACSLMLYALPDTPNQIVAWQQNWLLYLSCCYSNKHPSLSRICCAKQSPYQHLAHRSALCQSGPQCQDCQPMTEAQTHFLSLRLHHGFIIIPLSLPSAPNGWDRELLSQLHLILPVSPPFSPLFMCSYSPYLSTLVALQPLNPPKLKFIAIRPGHITSDCSTSSCVRSCIDKTLKSLPCTEQYNHYHLNKMATRREKKAQNPM